MRDEFTSKTKELLFKRVGGRCSNPNCRKATSAPHTDINKSINVGIAAHITAAELNGPRYDPNMSSEERKSVENGIWLCQDHAKLIDCDEMRYTVEIIKEWRTISEKAALLDIEYNNQISTTETNEDKRIIKFYSQCFDRPAFQDEFVQEGSIEAFDRAIEDTITAINVGCLKDRDGNVLFQCLGKSYLFNPEWREKMDSIVDMMRAIRSRYRLAVHLGQIDVGGEYNGRQFYFFHNYEVAKWFDETRSQILFLFSEICKEAGIPKLVFPRKNKSVY
ncbi:HNH endonuclease [Paenibacillus sp. HW567]|uniref:HNH endonuclease n=1 Tax=Paenibacillus sp. HW567 TaxID=1034769 RepID=UPI0003769AC4|nr:HNH endonuclease [Paenibacillus sp. HW567]